MELTSVTEIWKWFRWLPKFFLRKIFSVERISELVLVDVRPRHKSVSVNLSENASFEIYFQITNMSPFQVEWDRAEIVLQVNGARMKCQHILKTKFVAGEIGSLFVEGEINSANADHIAKYGEKENSSIELNIDFNCSLHNFSKSQLRLEGVNVQYTNLEWRKSQLENGT